MRQNWKYEYICQEKNGKKKREKGKSKTKNNVLPKKKTSGLNSFTLEFYKIFDDERMLNSYKRFQKIEE